MLPPEVAAAMPRGPPPARRVPRWLACRPARAGWRRRSRGGARPVARRAPSLGADKRRSPPAGMPRRSAATCDAVLASGNGCYQWNCA